MGHYAAEMQCDKCGQLRCVCPIPPDKTLQHFVIDSDFTICTAEEYIKRHGTAKMKWGTMDVSGSARMALAFMKKYKKRADAEIAARSACEEAVEALRARLLATKKILKVTRPWEAK